MGGGVILKVSRLEVIQILMEGLRDEEKVIKQPALSRSSPENTQEDGIGEYGSRRYGRGFTLWFTGLSGAGKATIAEFVEKELRENCLLLPRPGGTDPRAPLQGC